MAIKTTRPTVGTTRTALTTVQDAPAGVYVEVLSGVPVFIGGPDVTPTNGKEVAVGRVASLDLPYGDAVYAVTASGSAVVQTIQTGV